MSFHPRKYFEKFEDRYFSTDEFQEYLENKATYNIINLLLINAAKFGTLSLDDSHTLCLDLKLRKKLLKLQDKYLENEKFRKWIDFLCKERHERYEARETHLQNKNKGNITLSHAKKNTMKLFFNDRDEEPRELPENKKKLYEIKDPEKQKKLTENVKKFEIFINFIKQMSKKYNKRQFGKSFKERVFHFI